jgi:hypothetical protein
LISLQDHYGAFALRSHPDFEGFFHTAKGNQLEYPIVLWKYHRDVAHKTAERSKDPITLRA